MAIADVYDALLSKRVYKPPMTFQATATEIRNSSGTHFDPELVKLVLEERDMFEEVHKRFQIDE
jgi:putative two-component system response regulator